MSQHITLDIETRSACDLKVYGAHQYAKHETTRLLTVAWKDGEQYHVWLPGLQVPPPESFRLLHLPDCTVHIGDAVPLPLYLARHRPWVGHNVQTFDRLVWAECTEGFEDVEWVDTYPLALACGMPGGLDPIGKMLWGEGKYAGGKEQLKKAMKATSLDDCEPENVPLGQLILVARYNVQDVKLTDELFVQVTREARLPPFECRVKRAHDVINNRGFKLDVPLARALVTLADESKAHAVRQIRDLTDGVLPDQATLQSRTKVLGWLAGMGVRLHKNGKPSLAKDVVTRYIDHNRSHEKIEEENADGDDGGESEDNTPEAQANLSRIVKVLELRMSALRITGGKLDAALHAVDHDGRIRFWAAYWSAHTGRWAGRRVQPHNFPRPKEGVDTWALLDLFDRTGRLAYDDVRSLMPIGDPRYPYLSVDDAASALLRSIIAGDPTLAAADLANIEARVLAWCAGEKWLMDSFWAGGDPYIGMAERIFGKKDSWPRFPDPKNPGEFLSIKKHPYRQVGKIVELGSGYGLGPDQMAFYAVANGIDLGVVGTTAAECIYAYRHAHPAIAGEYTKDGEDGRPMFYGGIWHKLQNAAIMTVQTGERTYAARCEFTMSVGSLICTLPSGRRLVYRKPRVEDTETRWGLRPALSYWSPRYGRKGLYGGSLAENVVQAIARDVLAHGMVLIEDEGMPVVLHVHDEAVASTDRLHDFMRCMTTPPNWLTGFPLAAEGSLMPRYSKTPPPGTKDILYVNGIAA